MVAPPAHRSVEHLNIEEDVTGFDNVGEVKEMPQLKGVRAGEVLLAALEVHVALAVEPDHHGQEASSAACLS